MKPKVELLLNHLLWTVDRAMHPTFRNLSESFESWAYRSGFLREIQQLVSNGLIESQQSSMDCQRVVRLTVEGRRKALGGRDPDEEWNRPWDGLWRMVLYDIPEENASLRRNLRRALREYGFGNLQGSVWVRPQEPKDTRGVFREKGKDCTHFLFLRVASEGIKMDQRIVCSAWNYQKLNQCYSHELTLLQQLWSNTPRNREELHAWSREECSAWMKAIRSDPLLPRALLPRGYLGRKAWCMRKQALVKAAELVAQL